MLSAINLGRVGYGLVLTLVFSFGLAATLTIVGLAFLYAGKSFGGSKFGQNASSKLCRFSARSLSPVSARLSATTHCKH
jgi:ABC-type nickel/cobalt efflux system permease component RcnA